MKKSYTFIFPKGNIRVIVTLLKNMDAEISIIGAGVIGLAIAERLAGRYDKVYLIEKNSGFGQETSSRNSEVIHAGIYYPEGSLKARLCVEGREMLYDFCKNWDVSFNNCGKLIVATSEEEIKVLDGIRNTALRNGVELQMLGKEDIRLLEPNIFALKALYSRTTGIIDSHALMKRLETNFLNKGGQAVYSNEVTGIRRTEDGYTISVREPSGSSFDFTSSVVINSAGLYSDKISEMTGIYDEKLSIRFCKGEYFRVKPPLNKLINRLVYPVPHHNLEGIGIHVTIDMGGGVKLGPDVTYLDSNLPDYKVDASKKDAFWKSAAKFLPFIGQDDLIPDMAGIRPKTQKPGEPVRDFYINEESTRGCPGFINLVGMESPGLTSSLAIAKYVEKLIPGIK